MANRQAAILLSVACGLACMACQPLTAAVLSDDVLKAASRYPALKMIQPDGLPVRLAQENWDKARNSVVVNPEWKTWLESRRKNLDQWMARPRDHAEWVAGWGFDLIDPVTGALVKWNVDMPEPGNIGGQPEKFRQAWYSWNRSYNIGQIVEAARIYKVTGNRSYAEWAASQLDFYSSNYSKWSLRTWNGKARMMGQSLDEATSIISMIEATRLISDAVDKQRVGQWHQKLFMPVVANLREVDLGVNNIALWHAIAVALVGYQFNNSALVIEAFDGPKGIRTLLDKGLTADDIWYEGTFAYNAYVVTALTPLFIQGSLYGDAERLKPLMIKAQNLILAPMQFRFDDGNLPTPGDAMAHLRAIDLGLHASVYRVLPTRIGVIEAQRVKSWDTLVDPAEMPTSKIEPLSAVVSANFEAIRMAVLKSEPWQVFVHYGQVTQFHAQEEATSYELYAGMEPVSKDQGTVAYGSDLHANYFRRGIAHNVPLVNGEGQVGWAPGEVIRFDASANLLSVAQPGYRPDATVVRTYEIKDNVFDDRVSIGLLPSISEPQRLGMLFNTECKIEFSPGSLGATTKVDLPATKGFGYWKDISAFLPAKEWTVVLNCHENKFALKAIGPLGHTLYVASVPATPIPARRQAIYLETKGHDAFFEFKIEPIYAAQ